MTTPAQEVVEVGVDGILEFLVQGAAEGVAPNGLPITLNVRGSLVTGLLVSRDRWAEAMTELGANPAIVGTSNVAQVLGDHFQQIFRKTDLEQSEDEPVIYGFIHLIDARMSTGFALVPNAAGLPWRGRLSEVSGWSIGVMAA